ncbi:DUF4347 domain-containing protein [Dyadobacter sp. LHD-138]|uniref:DUF4347 domain-containing protein n=1 Tax=Dyadobacter sp. LHD-138 TaxID=3071413 RepID=UPI0027DEEB2A|nr:DUF4347 domain-containing protein [Dyadobacter sp. LHD-138]MDQ6480557.1 DUF4347 domain-containing protein [Dyadobacter sp. LHD-138]
MKQFTFSILLCLPWVLHGVLPVQAPERSFSQRQVSSQKTYREQMPNVFIDAAVKKSGLETAEFDTNIYHLLSHGRPGELLIDGEWKNAGQIAAFLRTVTPNIPTQIHHLNIYGCEFGKGRKGQEAVEYLESTLGLSISASDDITGKGGDWVLEIGKPWAGNGSLSSYTYSLQYGPSDDFDGDGVINSADIDDDNDGAPDDTENGCVVQTLIKSGIFALFECIVCGHSGTTKRSLPQECTCKQSRTAAHQT